MNRIIGVGRGLGYEGVLKLESVLYVRQVDKTLFVPTAQAPSRHYSSAHVLHNEIISSNYTVGLVALITADHGVS